MTKVIEFSEVSVQPPSSGMSPTDLVAQVMRNNLEFTRILHLALGVYINNSRHLQKKLSEGVDDWSDEDRVKLVTSALEVGIELTGKEASEASELADRFAQALAELEHGGFDTAIELLEESAESYREQAIDQPDSAFLMRRAAVGDDVLVEELKAIDSASLASTQ